MSAVDLLNKIDDMEQSKKVLQSHLRLARVNKNRRAASLLLYSIVKLDIKLEEANKLLDEMLVTDVQYSIG
jgi:hypothetical protein